MRKNFKNFFIPGRRFKNEFKSQIRMLIIVTLGFTIAFTWRQTIFDLSQYLIKSFTKVQDSSALSILASIFITIVSVILICLTAYYLKENKNNY